MKRKLLIISDDPNLTSGLGRIVRELSSKFFEKFDMRVAGWHHLPMPHAFPFYIYSLEKNDPSNKNINDLKLILRDFLPNIVFFIGDVWDLLPLRGVLGEYKETRLSTKIIGWITIDGEGFHTSWAEAFQFLDKVLTFSFFGQREILRLSKVKADVVYPGVDHKVFFDRKVQLQTTEKTLHFDPNKTFLILNVNQNTDRKNFPLLLESFEEFSREKEDVHLFLATDPNDPQGYDLWDMIQQLKIGRKVAVTRDVSPVGGIPDNKLNFIYNLATIFVSASIGDGFGLSYNEAMACGVPVVATDYSSFSDDTLVMMPGAIKHFSDLKVGDLVWSKNLATEELQASPIQKIIVKEHSGPVINIKSSKINLRLTPDHRVIVRESFSFKKGKKTYKKWSGWKKIDAENLLRKRNWKIPLTASWNSKKCSQYIELPTIKKTTNSVILEKVKLDDYLELLGWYITEGCLLKDKTEEFNRINIFEPFEGQYRNEIVHLVERIGLKVQNNPEGGVGCYSKQLCKRLLQDGGLKAAHKMISQRILDLPKKKLQILFKTLMKGDGSKSIDKKVFRIYTTVSEQLVANFLELSIKCGYSAHYIRRKPTNGHLKGSDRNIKGYYPVYQIFVRYKELEGYLLTKRTVSKSQYRGKTWCVSVKNNGNLLVGRDGKFSFCGNSPPELLADGRGRLIKVAGFLRGAFGIQRALISKRDLIEHLEVLYQDWKGERSLLRSYCEKGKVFVKTLSWNRTADQLISAIEDSLKEKKQPSWIKKHTVIKDIRFLMVAPSWGKNCGIAEYSKSLCEHLRLQNFGVMVFPSNDLATLEGFVEKHGINVIHYQHEFSFWPDKEKLLKNLKNFNQKGIRIILTLHSFCKGLVSYNLMLAQNVDRLIVHAHPFKDEFQALENIEAEFKPQISNINFIPMGCRKAISFDKQEIEKTKEHLGIADRFPIVGSFGFLREQKGYRDLVLAVRSLQEKFKNILCLIYAPPHEFGSRLYDEQFFKFIEREGLEDMVLVIREYSKEEKMLKILQSADLFVLNYKDSPVGGGISAAVKTLMRVQRPIIVADSIAFRDLDREVVKIKKPTVEKLSDAMDHVWMNEDLKRLLVNRANAFLENNSWEKVALEHLKIYGE